MKVHVRYLNTNGFVRFCLQRADGRFWTPRKKWSRHQRRAMLYANLGDCHKDYFALTDKEPKGKCRHFVARFDVFVNGDEPFTEEDLKEWLMRHVNFTVTTEDGPVDGCKTQIYARYGTLAEKTYERQGEAESDDP
jgi:hypothetical protein